MSQDTLRDLIAWATAAFNRLSPEEQAQHRKEQAESWVRGEMAMNERAVKIRPAALTGKDDHDAQA